MNVLCAVIITIIELTFGMISFKTSLWVCARPEPWEVWSFACAEICPTGCNQPLTVGPGNGRQPRREAAEACVLPPRTWNETEQLRGDAVLGSPPPPPHLWSHPQVDLVLAPLPPGHSVPSTNRLGGTLVSCWHCKGFPGAEWQDPHTCQAV